MKAIAIAIALLAVGGGAWYVLSSDDDASDPVDVGVEDSPRSKARRGKSAAGGSGRSRGDASDDNRGSGSLEQRVAQLEKEVGLLRRQLALRGRVAVAGGGGDIDSIADDPVLDQQVRDIVGEEREQEREREMERRRERFDEFRSEALDELVEIGNLSTDQRESIDGLWSTEADRLVPLLTAMRSGERGWSETREELRTLRKETDDAAKAVLSDSQYETYLDKRPRGPGGRGRGGGGRGGPSGGGGGGAASAGGGGAPRGG
ncbi:MAG: hypothetical protein K0V04_30350 [Deltaproteobacteria bacterium]|nr:hypothetical protein [Deltaproteobacteria bacterium]